MLADKGYVTDAIRGQIGAAGAAPNIPPKISRRWKPRFSSVLYRRRNAIARIFGRLLASDGPTRVIKGDDVDASALHAAKAKVRAAMDVAKRVPSVIGSGDVALI